MTTHTWTVIALVLFLAAAVISATQKTWTISLIAAGLACTVIPTALQLTS